MPDEQIPFEYSEKQIEWLLRCTSRERMQPYYLQAKNDDWEAFHLYVRNTNISASLYKVMQALEVSLRNIIHSKLSEALGSEEWWSKLPLQNAELNDIEKAKENIEIRLKAIRPGRIVAELNFGFWVKLFANTYEKQLWVPHTTKLFPAKLSRKLLHTRLTELKDRRNRIAHHETLLKRDPAADYANLLETIRWISPSLHKWVEHNADFPETLAKKIPKKPIPSLRAIEGLPV